MFDDLNIQHIGWACTLLGGFLCGLLTFWLLRPKPKRMLFQVADLPKPTPYASARESIRLLAEIAEAAEVCRVQGGAWEHLDAYRAAKKENNHES